MAELRKKVLIAITAIMGLFVVSCNEDSESTFVGLDYRMNQELKYEYLSHDVELDTLVNKLYTVEQKVAGNLALYEGRELIDGQAFEYDLNLEVLFEAEPKVVYVLSKDNLTNVTMTSSKIGDEDVSDSMDTKGFKTTSVKRSYEFYMNEGEQIKAHSLYERLSHKDTTFTHAKVVSVTYNKYEARLNEEISNADSTAYDINLYFDVKVVCEGDSDKNDNYAVRVPIRRIYKEAPADAVTTIEGINYVAEFATRENELYTVRQFVTGDYVTRLRDEEIGRKTFKYDLNLNCQFKISPEVVKVDAESKLSDVALKTTTVGEAKEETEKKDEFELVRTSRDYTFNFNEGEVVTSKALFEKLSGKDVKFASTEIKSVTYKKYEAKLNENETTSDIKVYDVKLYFDVEVESKENASVNAVYTVELMYQRVYEPVKEDTYETVIENTDYEGEFDAKVKELYTVKQQVTGEFVTYKNNEVEVSRKGFERAFNLEALFDAPEVVYVETETQLSTVSLSTSSKDGDRENKVTTDGFTTTTRSLDYNFKFNENERVKSRTAYERENHGEDVFAYASIDNVTYKRYEAKKNDVRSNADSTVYDITLYFDVRVIRRGVVETKATANEEIHSVAVPYSRVYKHVAPQDELIGKRADNVTRRIINENTEEISWTEVEIWSVSGEKTTQHTYNLYRTFNEPSLHWVYTANTDYSTSSNGQKYLSETTSKDGNWTVTTRYEEYSSIADNGANSFNNVYAYSYQKASYKDEYYSLNFDYATWQITEGLSEVVATSNVIEKNGKIYDVSDYTNNINTVYSVTNDSYTANAQANAKIAVERPAERILPESWGKIIGAGISAVPADDKGGDYAQKCINIRTENGSVAIVFDIDATVPSVDAILAGYFVEGKFGAEYNSGFYTTSTNKGSYAVAKWAPAIAKDLSDRIAYYDGETCKRNIRNTTLQMWNWRDGNYSTTVDGYTFSVSNDGTLTVKYNGAVALQIR